MVFDYDTKSLLKGLMLVTFVLLALAFANAGAQYKLNYDIYPESNTLTLQQGTDYQLRIYYGLNSDSELTFYQKVDSPLYAYITPKTSNFSNFDLPLYIKVGNELPGDYPVKLITAVNYNGMTETRETIINVKVIAKEKLVYKTSDYTNEAPKLVLQNISTRNILIDANKEQTVLFSFKNVGSSSTFKIGAIVDSPDKNKLNLTFNENYFSLSKDEERNIILTIKMDEDYNINYTPIYFYAIETLSGEQIDLGQLNLTLKNQDILVAYTKNTKELAITNVGTEYVSLDVNTNKREFSLLLQPSQTYFLQAEKEEKDLNVYFAGQLYKEIDLQTAEDQNLDVNKSNFSLGTSFTGLFSFGEGSTIWIIIAIFIIAFFALIYKMFLSSKAIFAKNVYVKNIDLKSENL